MRRDAGFVQLDFDTLSGEDSRSFLDEFSLFIRSWYAGNGRKFEWRETCDPYRILLSELMLQQTQTGRVLPKYRQFLSLWPTLEDMAASTLTDVLFAWKGLGYNRRAKALRDIARMSEPYGYTLPPDEKILRTFPMIGEATSAAIMAFAYQKRSIYLETNIRRVIIHHFFVSSDAVKDREIRKILEALADRQSDMKMWYYALMDYGVMIKKTGINPNRRSHHYHKQSPFENSNRQIRSALLHTITVEGIQPKRALLQRFSFEPGRIEGALKQLEDEGFIEQSVSETEVCYQIREEL
ncbi:MAG: DNA repair protein [Sphaerochaetaceae bacterium]|nr:DNA repair protein [Sphaerochaetaceae bacterium]MDC7248160.1 DNA repair protein [Sphaerochaetaceae bacterium]